MFVDMDLWIEIRRRVLSGELSKRNRPGYRLTKKRPSKLEPFRILLPPHPDSFLIGRWARLLSRDARR